MTKEAEISTCISGSFKFKPDIDLLIEEFQDLHVKVLSPEKGWLVVPRYQILRPGFRPLPSEKGMTVRHIEDGFLRHIESATFLYVGNFEGYTGLSTFLEIGFALGTNKPVYCVNEIKRNEENDLWFEEVLKESIKAMTPEDTVKDVRKQIENSPE